MKIVRWDGTVTEHRIIEFGKDGTLVIDTATCDTIPTRDIMRIIGKRAPVAPIRNWDMWFCGYCKYAITRTVKYCPMCGTAVDWERG